MPKLSIIMPIYNAERFLAQSVDSVLAQTFGDFELLLIDDGSTDNSLALAGEYAKNDPRIISIHKENGGTSSARNMGIELAKGSYIGFMDNDDYLLPFMYEKLYEKATATDADVVKCGMIPVDDGVFVSSPPTEESGVVSRHRPYSYDGNFLTSGQYLSNCIRKIADAGIWNILVRQDVCKKIRFWNRYFEDWKFHYDLTALTDGYETIPEHGYIYLQRDDSRLRGMTASDELDISYFTMLLSDRLAETGHPDGRARAIRDCHFYYLRCLKELRQIPPEKLTDMLAITEFLQKHAVK